MSEAVYTIVKRAGTVIYSLSQRRACLSIPLSVPALKNYVILATSHHNHYTILLLLLHCSNGCAIDSRVSPRCSAYAHRDRARVITRSKQLGRSAGNEARGLPLSFFPNRLSSFFRELFDAVLGSLTFPRSASLMSSKRARVVNFRPAALILSISPSLFFSIVQTRVCNAGED